MSYSIMIICLEILIIELATLTPFYNTLKWKNIKCAPACKKRISRDTVNSLHVCSEHANQLFYMTSHKETTSLSPA